MRAGRPRCSKTYHLALDYLLLPRKTYGIQKMMAYAHDIEPRALNAAISTIKSRIKKL